ncbi:ABC-ATPase domain-containing protein [Tuberibacillus sp. Marseille-P3662]|uniref:ABC-ATPase domain-containing protein n=1 Tax=Tuberibacillus sp. Marseille-P3662 TaxID=1965358 RepID=UPI000A1C7F61|nr:ABC-ATPase domain-containing protein [Tuberibacillus sp. Marseille-P3662]
MQQLKSTLKRIDGKGYKAYKDIQGNYRFPDYQLAIDYVQGDPFASPSKFRVIIPRETSAFGDEATATKSRKVASEDDITRFIDRAIKKESGSIKGSGKSGLLTIDVPGQEVIERTAVTLTPKSIIVCLSVGLPAQGRRVLGQQAEKIFLTLLPNVIRQSVLSIQASEVDRVTKLADQQQAIRQYMQDHSYITFVADGAILPRASGVNDRPLQKGKVVPFESPESMKVSIDIPYRDKPLTGMAIPKGISLIVGGGFHGKSTLLEALQKSVYDHIEGDGREFVCTDPTAVKIRAEDGRSVEKVDISPFINDLPYDKDTASFTSEDASGSTSQAANIIEALEAGTETILIDEDTSATNFMIRDARMQALVAKATEPITPFIDKVTQLYADYGVSTILVMGGAGDYFDVADQVIQMDKYVPYDVTDQAKSIAKDIVYQRQSEGGSGFGDIQARTPTEKSVAMLNDRKNKVKTRSKYTIQLGKTTIALSHVEQIVEDSQTRMIAEILSSVAKEQTFKQNRTLSEWLDQVEEAMDDKGLDTFGAYKGHPGELARPRRFEIAASLNRLRTLEIK